jgi:hypothetical protein
VQKLLHDASGVNRDVQIILHKWQSDLCRREVSRELDSARFKKMLSLNLADSMATVLGAKKHICGKS